MSSSSSYGTLLALLALLSPAAAAAQSSPADSALLASNRSVTTLVEQLPGNAVSLASLVDVAMRDAFDMRLALAARREAGGIARSAGRVLDPVAQVGTDVAAGGTDATRTRNSAIGVLGALPWGTQYAADAVRQSGIGLGSAPSATGAQTLYALSVSQPLLEGLNQRTADWRAADRERTAAELNYRRARERVATAVEVEYWTLAEAQAVEAVYQRSLELSRAFLARNIELAKRDLIADVDVLTVRGGVAQREGILNAAQQARRERSDALVLLAYGERAISQLESDSLPVKAIDREPDSTAAESSTAALQRALTQRGDVRAARERVDAAAIRQSRARNATRPGLDVTGGWSSSTVPALGNVAGNPGTAASAWRLGLSLSTPLFNRGDLGASQLANAAVDIETTRLRAAEGTALVEIREASRGVAMGFERLAITQRSANLTWEQLVAERRRLDLGLGDSFRLLQTEERAVQAQLDAVRARYDVLRAQARYRLALGSAN